ncbi:MAG: cyclic nucleotide-binding and patatin-like phospholipase domain-containing protein [Hyphomicrobium sp.]
MPSSLLRLSHVETFRGLSAADLALLEARLAPLSVRRGTALVSEGDKAEALYVVVSGRFCVEVAGNTEPVAEISAGATIGEIAFFAGGARTATVRAIRDSVVVQLTRADFDEISGRAPAIWANITSTLASRLAAETRKSARLKGSARPKPRARTLTIVRAGGRPIPPQFLRDLAAGTPANEGTLILDRDSVADHVPGGSVESIDATRILNELEGRTGTLMFIADNDLTPWSEKAIRQADEILLVATQGDDPIGAPVPLNGLEQFILALEHQPRLRLAVVHKRQGGVQGTRHWLSGRTVIMHHHVALADSGDIARLWRFIRGEALGLVACGGGAYCAAHIGLYKAFKEQGIGFDLLGGASGGAAMAAAFAEDVDAAEIDARVHRMFIDGKAMQRYTLPRYSLLDHTHFDSHLIAQYGNTRIEDMWRPYFAVAMDLADSTLEVLRNGPVWAAIRASAAIPALLPPYYTEDGRMLVDGSVVSNVPIDVMRQIKAGPNVVVTFDPPLGERFKVDYGALPGRQDLLWKSFNPWTRAELPSAPSPATVLVRSLMANRNHFERHLEDEDWLLMPPTPSGMGALDWRRHSELVESAYRYALDEIAKRRRPTSGEC